MPFCAALTAPSTPVAKTSRKRSIEAVPLASMAGRMNGCAGEVLVPVSTRRPYQAKRAMTTS